MNVVAEHLVLSASYAMAIAFAISSLVKIRRYRSFVGTVVGYDLLPHGLAVAWAALLPCIEAALAVMLLTGAAARAALVALALLAVFAIAVAINLLRRRSVPCGCFGDNEPISVQTLLRIALLALLALSVAVLPRPAARPVDAVLVGTLTAALLLVLGSWLLHLREVIGTLRRVGG